MFYTSPKIVRDYSQYKTKAIHDIMHDILIWASLLLINVACKYGSSFLV